MSSTHFEWSKLITALTDPSCGIPTDVTFEIVENGQLRELKAHKMLLAMVSDIFKTMFYGTNVGDRTADVIKVEKTTTPAFQIVLDAVYNAKSIEASLEGKSVHEVFDVVILVERYQIKQLMEPLKKHLAKFLITDDTVLEVAEDAKEYIGMFEEEAEMLLDNCAKYLKYKLKDVDAMTRFAAEHKDKGEVFASLMARMHDMEHGANAGATASQKCLNCKKDICKDGERVMEHEFRVGLVVTKNRATKSRASGLWGDDDYGTVRVTRVTAEDVDVESINLVEFMVDGQMVGGQMGEFDVPKTHSFFLFHCT